MSDFLTYKNKPLVRSGNVIYYGDMSDKFVIKLEILTSHKDGELEIGQIASDIKQITSAAQVVEDMITRYNLTIETLSALRI